MGGGIERACERTIGTERRERKTWSEERVERLQPEHGDRPLPKPILQWHSLKITKISPNEHWGETMGESQFSGLIDDFLRPEIPPEEYSPLPNVVVWRLLEGGGCVLEVFRRNDGSFGFQYRVWVAWRDAGSEVQGHGWYRISPRIGLIDDSLTETCALACKDAGEFNMEITGEWVTNVNNEQN